MNKEIFKSDRYFTAFDFVLGHGQLLLRSSKDDSNKKNIDIIFFGTKYVQLFTSLWGIRIKLVEKDKGLIKYNSVGLFLNSDINFLFEIETKDEKYYIAASYLKVYENELEFNETSLGLGLVMGREKEISGSK
ncbi:hypothetical protein [Mucilaginibacter flavus]|uniref:hypothetical protein n=1 Tax=Mucilaginibacter flavus TaxID=931504 RepID=UPI0025B2CF87|nr:hypothetical protein [Mucilaginibacter flavus]MDN3584378.1 hypothetical protein [Mucilaginibacter flavus]